MHHEKVASRKFNLIIAEFPYYSEIADNIESYIIQNGKRRHQASKALMSDWYSDSPEFRRINEWVLSLIEEDTDPASSWRKGRQFCVYNCWGNVYEKGASVESHDHLPYYLSFVYFAKAGENAAPLVFSDSGLSIKPRIGKVVIFPSHLSHEVPVQKSASARVTVSGNIFWKAEYLYKDMHIPASVLQHQA